MSFEERRRAIFSNLSDEQYAAYVAQVDKLVEEMGQNLTLREKVQRAIESKENAADQAIAVCEVIENAVGLAGNGWFDDDKIMCERLGMEYEEDEDGEDDA